MKHLIIIGARGFGREIFGMVHTLDAYQRGEYDIKGFLDDKADALDGFECGHGEWPPVLGAVEMYSPQVDDVFFCALGNSVYRRKYAEMILDKGGEFVSLISPLAKVAPSARIGVGVSIPAWTTVSCNVEVGDFTMVHSFCTFGHDAKVGRFCSLESYVFLGGFAEAGEGATLHVRSAIIPHKRIGANTSVGFGSVVMRNFGDNVHLFGNPAKKIDY